jgi:hypothetical protein
LTQTVLLLLCVRFQRTADVCIRCSATAKQDKPNLERWPSGRRRSPAKGVYLDRYRGFESLPLRHIKKAHFLVGFFVLHVYATYFYTPHFYTTYRIPFYKVAKLEASVSTC